MRVFFYQFLSESINEDRWIWKCIPRITKLAYCRTCRIGGGVGGGGVGGGGGLWGLGPSNLSILRKILVVPRNLIFWSKLCFCYLIRKFTFCAKKIHKQLAGRPSIDVPKMPCKCTKIWYCNASICKKVRHYFCLDFVLFTLKFFKAKSRILFCEFAQRRCFHDILCSTYTFWGQVTNLCIINSCHHRMTFPFHWISVHKLVVLQAGIHINVVMDPVNRLLKTHCISWWFDLVC